MLQNKVARRMLRHKRAGDFEGYRVLHKGEFHNIHSSLKNVYFCGKNYGIILNIAVYISKLGFREVPSYFVNWI
jgi:hypothetical protein